MWTILDFDIHKSHNVFEEWYAVGQFAAVREFATGSSLSSQWTANALHKGFLYMRMRIMHMR